MTLVLQLDDVDATGRLGAALAATRPAQAVIYLQGDLGAGKTTLARALLRALGVSGAVRSPTYTLIERYPTAMGDAVHLDLYRIADPEELHYLGLDDLVASASLWLVEWPERGAGALPRADLTIELAQSGSGRAAHLHGSGAVGRQWVQALRDHDHRPDSVNE
jgi:tRNA threonylcarbamoyladenosine biosynthesis protein TsaE